MDKHVKNVFASFYVTFNTLNNARFYLKVFFLLFTDCNLNYLPFIFCVICIWVLDLFPNLAVALSKLYYHKNLKKTQLKFRLYGQLKSKVFTL